MTSVPQRQKLLGLIDKACADGARLSPACRQIGRNRPPSTHIEIQDSVW